MTEYYNSSVSGTFSSSEDDSDCESEPAGKFVRAKQVARHSTKGMATSSNRKWSKEEDEQLSHLVDEYGADKWGIVASFFLNRSDVQCQCRWQKVINPCMVKGTWTKEEDAKVVDLVKKFGPKKWTLIAKYLEGRIGKQCRERWHNHLNPDIVKTAWTEDEDRVICQAHKEWGNQWSKIAKLLPGRTDNAIKNHWNSSIRKRIDSDKHYVPKAGKYRSKSQNSATGSGTPYSAPSSQPVQHMVDNLTSVAPPSNARSVAAATCQPPDLVGDDKSDDVTNLYEMDTDENEDYIDTIIRLGREGADLFGDQSKHGGTIHGDGNVAPESSIADKRWEMPLSYCGIFASPQRGSPSSNFQATLQPSGGLRVVASGSASFSPQVISIPETGGMFSPSRSDFSADLSIGSPCSPCISRSSFGDMTALELVKGTEVNTGVTPVKYTAVAKRGAKRQRRDASRVSRDTSASNILTDAGFKQNLGPTILRRGQQKRFVLESGKDEQPLAATSSNEEAVGEAFVNTSQFIKREHSQFHCDSGFDSGMDSTITNVGRYHQNFGLQNSYILHEGGSYRHTQQQRQLTPIKTLPFSPSQFLNSSGMCFGEHMNLTSTPMTIGAPVGIRPSQISEAGIQNDHSTPKKRSCLPDHPPRTPTPFKRAMAEMEKQSGSFNHTIPSPTHLVDDICDIITKDLRNESCIDVQKGFRTPTRGGGSSRSLASVSNALNFDLGYESGRRRRSKENSTPNRIRKSLTQSWSTPGEISVPGITALQLHTPDSFMAPETPSKSLSGDTSVLFSPPSIIHEAIPNHQDNPPGLNNAFIVSPVIQKLDVRWEMVACGKTKDQVAMTEQAHRWVNTLRPRSLNL